MKLVLTATAAFAAPGLAAGSASAQYQTVVPHRGHYHVVPFNPVPVYGYPSYSQGMSVGGLYTSPGLGYGGGIYSSPLPYSSGYDRGRHHHHHYRHSHR